MCVCVCVCVCVYVCVCVCVCVSPKVEEGQAKRLSYYKHLLLLWYFWGLCAIVMCDYYYNTFLKQVTVKTLKCYKRFIFQINVLLNFLFTKKKDTLVPNIVIQNHI